MEEEYPETGHLAPAIERALILKNAKIHFFREVMDSGFKVTRSVPATSQLSTEEWNTITYHLLTFLGKNFDHYHKKEKGAVIVPYMDLFLHVGTPLSNEKSDRNNAISVWDRLSTALVQNLADFRYFNQIGYEYCTFVWKQRQREHPNREAFSEAELERTFMVTGWDKLLPHTEGTNIRGKDHGRPYVLNAKMVMMTETLDIPKYQLYYHPLTGNRCSNALNYGINSPYRVKILNENFDIRADAPRCKDALCGGVRFLPVPNGEITEKEIRVRVSPTTEDETVFSAIVEIPEWLLGIWITLKPQPGHKYRFVGFFDTNPNTPKKRMMGTTPYFRALAIENADQDWKSDELTEERIARFRKDERNPRFKDNLIASFAPHLVGMDDIKYGLLLCMVSGKNLDEDYTGRNTKHHPALVNVIIVGNPGLGKTDIVRWACSVFPGPYHFVNGSRTSTAGILGTIRSDSTLSSTGVLAPGAAQLAAKGILWIDELQSLMKANDVMQGLNTLIESHKIVIDMAGQHYVRSAPTRFIATFNPKKVGYGDSAEMILADKLFFEASTLSRFHLIYSVTKNPMTDAALRRRALYLRNGMGAQDGTTVIYDERYIRNYVAYCQSKTYVQTPEDTELKISFLDRWWVEELEQRFREIDSAKEVDSSKPNSPQNRFFRAIDDVLEAVCKLSPADEKNRVRLSLAALEETRSLLTRHFLSAYQNNAFDNIAGVTPRVLAAVTQRQARDDIKGVFRRLETPGREPIPVEEIFDAYAALFPDTTDKTELWAKFEIALAQLNREGEIAENLPNRYSLIGGRSRGRDA